MSAKTALVTGATGKIGRYLVRALASKGVSVRAVSRGPAQAPDPGSGRVEMIRGDILDRGLLIKAMRGCDCLFHLAAYQNAADTRKDEFTRVNVEGAKMVLGCARECGIKNVLYVSTAMVFEDTGKVPRGEGWQKKSSCEADHYLQTKIEALKLVEDMRNELPMVVVYPTAVIDLNDFAASAPQAGGLQKFLWEKIGGGIPGGLVSRIGPRGRVFNYVFVEDLADGMVRALFNTEGNGQYILGGENITAGDYLSRASARVRKKYFPFRIPLCLFKVLSFIGKLIPVPQMAHTIASGRLEDRCFSSDRAKKDLGYDPKGRL
ncbi:MAG: NAD-dependent epimerase/dehydratase family protein [Candidatus Omnitrophota bacterium]